MFSKKKVIITAALTGAIHTPTMSPYLPITPQQLIDETIAVHEAGGAVAHLHVRDSQNGYPTADQDVYREIATEVKKHCILSCASRPEGVLESPWRKR